jgi:hypothetical protein
MPCATATFFNCVYVLGGMDSKQIVARCPFGLKARRLQARRFERVPNRAKPVGTFRVAWTGVVQ